MLQDTIGNIGKAYDNLHNELKVLIFELLIENKQTNTPEYRQTAKLEVECKADNLNNKRRDFEVQAVVTKSDKMKKIGAGDETDKNKKPHDRKHKATGPLGINAATNTRNPLKSTGSPPSDTSTTEQIHARYYKGT